MLPGPDLYLTAPFQFRIGIWKCWFFGGRTTGESEKKNLGAVTRTNKVCALQFFAQSKRRFNIIIFFSGIFFQRYPPPKNGALACINIDEHKICAVMCHEKLDFEYNPAMIYTYHRWTGREGFLFSVYPYEKRPSEQWPDCSSKLIYIRLKLINKRKITKQFHTNSFIGYYRSATNP